MLFLLITKNRVPSYLGSSFAFLAPIAAALGANKDFGAALGGVVVTGVLLALVGLLVKSAGTNWINWLLPPVVTGTIVMVIGLNLAGAAKGNFTKGPLDAIVTLGAIALIAAISKGFMARISIFLGIVVGYVFAALRGDMNFDGVKAAKWFAQIGRAHV